MSSSSENKRKSFSVWFKNLKRPTQVIIVLAPIAGTAGLIYAATFLWGTAQDETNLTKEHYVTVPLIGFNTTGSIKPGGSISMSPVVTNNGDINCSAFIKLTIPTTSDENFAYDYETGC